MKPTLMRWAEMVDACKSVGLSRYAIRAAVQCGEICRITPTVSIDGREPRAYYSRENVDTFCRKILDNQPSNGLSLANGKRPGQLLPE